MIEIVKTSETTELDQAGNVVKKVRVVWNADKNHGPYVDYFPSATFDGADARRQLETKAANLMRLIAPQS
jgi:hypothetical protein